LRTVVPAQPCRRGNVYGTAHTVRVRASLAVIRCKTFVREAVVAHATAEVCERLLPHLELVPLKLGASVYDEAGGKQP